MPTDHALLKQEVFGPIAICQSFHTIQQVIEYANNSPYGLGASIWTQNPATQQQCIQQIQAGTIAINTPVQSQCDRPFGGHKQSGMGVELGIEGALSFTNIKSIINPNQ
tara:strand:+ start:574 stop:900 length:327 start_codon:yes stop_codon:yes gene_type:complete